MTKLPSQRRAPIRESPGYGISDDRGYPYGQASFTIPANSHQSGQSYLCFSRAGQSRSIIPAPRTTTQTFFGSDDLEISALQNTAISIGRIYVENSTPVTALLKPVGAGWVAGSSIELEILQADNRVIAHQLIRHGGTVAALETIAQTTGWHPFRAKGAGPGGAVPYEPTATYRGANQLTAD